MLLPPPILYVCVCISVCVECVPRANSGGVGRWIGELPLKKVSPDFTCKILMRPGEIFKRLT